MTLFRRPKFSLLLAVAELAAYLLSALITTAVWLACDFAGMTRHLHIVAYLVWIPLNLYLAWDAFCLARSHARRWPQSRGFAVLPARAETDRRS